MRTVVMGVFPERAASKTLPAGGAHVRRHPVEETDQGQHSRTTFAFLAETSRLLASSLDLESRLATAANVALTHFGAWCMVDVVEASGEIRRVAVIHPDAAKQRYA